MRTVAPAKINWTLEVLGRRGDGYHEIRSVIQTIDLCDVVYLEAADKLSLEVSGEHEATEDDLALKAARALAERVGRELPAAIRIEKRIPVAAGLGGGSSDAAALLRCMNCFHSLGLSQEELAAIGAGVGSDVPFFVFGGTALVEGRGERVTPLRDMAEKWAVLIVPPVAPVEKTERMYAALTQADFGDGSGTQAAMEAIQAGLTLDDWLITNVFERAAYEVFHDLAAYRYALVKAGASAVYLAGSGPGLFALAKDGGTARETAKRVKPDGGRVHAARTLRAREATGVEPVNGLTVSG